MNSENIVSSSSAEIERREFINLKEVVSKYLYFWPLFLLSLILSITIAFLYLRYTKPVFQVSSVLLIKDDAKGASTNEILNQLDLFGSSKVIENEIEVFKSKTLMRMVVDRLSLDVDLISEGRVVNSVIYPNKPLQIRTFEINPDIFNHTMVLTSFNAKTYEVADLKTGKKIRGNFSQLQRNAFGVFKISKTSFFKNEEHRSMKFIIKDPHQVTDNYLSALNVSVAGKQSTVIKLSMQSTIPQQGRDVLDTLVQVYNEVSLADKNQVTRSTIKFIDERLGLISGELTEVEKDVETFKTSNSLTDISAAAGLFLENVKSNDLQLTDINLKLTTIRGIEKYLAGDQTNSKLPSTFGINDPVLLGQIEQLGELQLRREELLSTTQPDNPVVSSIDKQVQTSRLAIRQTLESISSALKDTRKELESNDAKYTGSIRNIPKQEREFISIKRQQSIKESLYLFLLQKREESALSYASTVADSRIVDKAFASSLPVKPKGSVAYLFALVAGFIFPVVYLYIKDLLNNKVSHSSDITSVSSIPILGEIIYNESTEAIVVSGNNRKAISEQFRAIRTNLQFVQGSNKDLPKVTLFTSSMSGEGKSFVASNIAVALAISGKRTVLLELDLRKPKISKYLNLNNSTGLSNYLAGAVDVSSIVQPSDIHDNLFVIGSGPIPPNPSELLIQDSVEELIQYLKLNFDEILIDTPPIGLVTDAQILARVADATIYIVRHAHTAKNQVLQMDALYRTKKFPRMNAILNGIKVGGHHGYGYSYGYGYGYYSDDTETSDRSFSSLIKNLLKRF